MGVAVVDAVTCAYTRTGPDEQLPPAQFTVVPSEHLHTFAAVAVRPCTSGAAFSAAFCMPRVFDALPALELPSEHLHTFAAVAVRPCTSGAAFSAAFCMPRVFDALPALELPYWAPARAASATEMAVHITSV